MLFSILLLEHAVETHRLANNGLHFNSIVFLILRVRVGIIILHTNVLCCNTLPSLCEIACWVCAGFLLGYTECYVPRSAPGNDLGQFICQNLSRVLLSVITILVLVPEPG